MRNRNIIVNTQSILLLLLILGILWVAWLIKTVIISIFISLILALALEPFVVWLNKKRIPNGLSVLIVMLIFVAVLAGLGSFALVPFAQQSRFLINNLPQYLESAVTIPGFQGYVDELSKAFSGNISGTASNIVNTTIGVFSGALSTMVVLVFTTYILIDFNGIRDMFVNIFLTDEKDKIKSLLVRIENKLGAWLRGQLVLMLIIGVATYLGLILLGVDYALALAVIAGLLEIVPILGPIISAVPALIMGFVISPVTGFAVIGLYLLIQQLESNLIVPKVMQKAVGFNPLVTIIALMVGGQLMGIVGAILAVPIVIVAVEVVKFLVKEQRS